MSRYSEDWERRKSYLIRSLFYDIESRIPSTIPEDSTKSSPVADDRSSQSSSPFTSSTPQPNDSASLYEPQTPSETSSDTETRHYRPYAVENRPYSPLPPLIVEREPNKHDDPPEYYEKLLKKIRKIYRKLFIENRSLSDDDFLLSDVNDSMIIEANDNINDTVMIEAEEILNKEMTEELSDVSVESSGYSVDYSADVEFTDVDDDREISSSVHQYDDRLNQISELNNEVREFNEEEYEMDGNEDQPIVEIEEERSASIEEAEYRQITTRAEVHIDGPSPTKIRPSPVYERQQIELTSKPETIPPIDSAVSERRKSSTSIRMETSREHQESGDKTTSSGFEIGNPKISEVVSNAEKSNSLSARDETQNESIQTQDGEGPSSIEEPQIEYENYPRSSILTRSQVMIEETRGLRARSSEAMITEPCEADEREQIPPLRDSSHTVIDDVARTPAMVLRFRRSGMSLGRGTILEEAKDPDTIPSTAEASTPEIMRTPRMDASTESYQINITQLSNEMELTCVHETALQDVTNITASSHHNETADSRTFDHIEDILKSFFEETSEENVTYSNKKDARKIRGASRKRSYEEMSVQTGNVTWNDLRRNLFVGTPKIFKLCSCEGHVCN